MYAEVIQYDNEVYTLVYLTRQNPDHHTRDLWGNIDSIFDRTMKTTDQWILSHYLSTLTQEKVIGDGKRVDAIDPEYLKKLFEFYRLIENPSTSRLLLFEGSGMSNLLGTLDFNFRDTQSPRLPLEQERGKALPPDELHYGHISKTFAAHDRRINRDPSRSIHGSTIEANCFTAHPKSKNLAASLLWTAAIFSGILDSYRAIGLSKENRERLLKEDPKLDLPAEDSIGGYADFIELRPHVGMVGYFKKLGFELDIRLMRPLEKAEKSPAARYAEAQGMDQFNDVLLRAPREDWILIPHRLYIQKKHGARVYYEGSIDHKYADWVLEQMEKAQITYKTPREATDFMEARERALEAMRETAKALHHPRRPKSKK